MNPVCTVCTVTDALVAALVAALALGLLLQFWLASRQISHVSRHRNQVPHAFCHTVTLASHQKAADYTVAKTRLSLVGATLGAAVLLGWTLLGGLSWLDRYLTDGLGLTGMTQQLALLAAFALIGTVIDLPLTLYQTFVLEQRFGFNRMGIRLWLVDLLKSTLLAAMLGLPIAALVLWMMGAAGRWWWLWAWAVWMGLNLLLLVIYPTLIAPWFNRFVPLEDESLKNRVTALMQRCGFAAKGLFVMDGSRRSAHANAYFTGFGAARRVVFFDTLLSRLTADEVCAVLAHELGHFRHKHIVQRIAFLFALSLLGCASLGYLSQQDWFYVGLGVTRMPSAPLSLPLDAAPRDTLALLLFALVVPVFGFFVTPVMAYFSRRREFQADAYAVQQTSGADLASALLKLFEDNASTLTPDPVYVRFYYSHPAASERLARMLPTTGWTP